MISDYDTPAKKMNKDVIQKYCMHMNGVVKFVFLKYH